MVLTQRLTKLLPCVLLLVLSVSLALTGCFSSKTAIAKPNESLPVNTPSKLTLACHYDVKSLNPSKQTENLFLEKTKACLTSQSTEAEKLAYYESFLGYLNQSNSPKLPLDNPEWSVIEKIKPPAFRKITSDGEGGYYYITDYQAILFTLAKLPAYVSFPQLNDYLLLAEQAESNESKDASIGYNFEPLGLFIIKFEGYEKRYADKPLNFLSHIPDTQKPYGYYYSFKGCLDNSPNLTDDIRKPNGETLYTAQANALNAYAFYLQYSPLEHTHPTYQEIQRLYQTLSSLKNKHITSKEYEKLVSQKKLGNCNISGTT